MNTTVPKLAPRRKRKPLSRSETMGRIRSKNTRPEILARAAVHASGNRFRVHVATLPGKPDLANKSRKWVIFVHGCFWHSHAHCRLASKPRSNQSYWFPKLRDNRARDRLNLRVLRSMGYRVLVLWECQVRDGCRMQEALNIFFQQVSATHQWASMPEPSSSSCRRGSPASRRCSYPFPAAFRGRAGSCSSPCGGTG